MPFSPSRSFLAQWRAFFLLLATALILAACGGNPVKSDLQNMQKALTAAGFSQAKMQELNQKMQGVKNEEEAKPIIQELSAMFAKGHSSLTALSYKSPEVKTQSDKLAGALKDMGEVMDQSLTITPQTDMQTRMQLGQKAQKAKRDSQEAMNALKDLAQKSKMGEFHF